MSDTNKWNILAAALAVQDARLEPYRSALHFPRDGNRQIRHSALRWEKEVEFKERGAIHLAKDRSSSGRAETAKLLSALASEGLIEVSFVAGRASRLKLTPEGDETARRLCGEPTLASSAGIFHRLATLLKRRRFVRTWPPARKGRNWWYRRDCLWEFGLVHPDGCTDLTRKTGIVSETLRNIMPWIIAGLVEWFYDTSGNAYYRLTRSGDEHFANTDWSQVNLDWMEAWQQQRGDTYDEIGDNTCELSDLCVDTFKRERESLRTGQPKSLQELGRIPWSCVDEDLELV